MNICGIICEYNPLHTGHRYQFLQAKRESGCDAVICLISGNFVQRSTPSVCDVYSRARAALKMGADMVIAMPTVVSAARGQLFASGAINILAQIPNLSHLSFGAENDEIRALSFIAKVQANESEDFKAILKTELANGNSYAKSLTTATAKICNESAEGKAFSSKINVEEILLKPNNLLGIEYIKSILKCGKPITPVPIARLGDGYNDFGIKGFYASATALRAQIEKGDFTSVMPYLPTGTEEILLSEWKNFPLDLKRFSDLCVFALRNREPSLYPDCSEGIENKLYSNAMRFTNLNDILLETKTKRYTLSRLRRIATCNLLEILDKDFIFDFPLYSRLIAVKNESRHLISSLPSTVVIQNSDFNNLSERNKSLSKIDLRASNIYSLLTNKQGNQFFNNKIIID